MQSAFGSQLPHIGTSAVRFSKNIERLSAGKFEIKVYEPAALVPPPPGEGSGKGGLGPDDAPVGVGA